MGVASTNNTMRCLPLLAAVAAVVLGAVAVSADGFPLGISPVFLNHVNDPTNLIAVQPNNTILKTTKVFLPANMGFDLMVFGSFASTTNAVSVTMAIPSIGASWSGNFMLKAGDWARTLVGLGGWNATTWTLEIGVPAGAPGPWFTAGGSIPNGTSCCAQNQCYCSMDAGLIAMIVPATPNFDAMPSRTRRSAP